MFTICTPGTCEEQKRISDPLELELDGCELCGSWKLDTGSVQEQQMLIAEPSLQLQNLKFLIIGFVNTSKTEVEETKISLVPIPRTMQTSPFMYPFVPGLI